MYIVVDTEIVRADTIRLTVLPDRFSLGAFVYCVVYTVHDIVVPFRSLVARNR